MLDAFNATLNVPFMTTVEHVQNVLEVCFCSFSVLFACIWFTLPSCSVFVFLLKALIKKRGVVRHSCFLLVTFLFFVVAHGRWRRCDAIVHHSFFRLIFRNLICLVPTKHKWFLHRCGSRPSRLPSASRTC